VADQFKVGAPQQAGNVGLLAGEKVVQTDDVVSLFDQTLTNVGAQKTSSAGYKNSLDHCASSLQALEIGNQS
jgi:hypothetical protein